MRTFRRIAVYCGSSDDVAPRYFELAREVGRTLAARGIGIVYGGGRVGLMGAVADAALDASGSVFGVIPRRLQDREVGHTGLTELFVVDSMHARKAMMTYLSDAFIALPGGFGTLEEIIEVATLAILGYHHKPVGLLDADGYYDHLLAFIDRAATDGFVRPQHRELLQVADRVDVLLGRLASADLSRVEMVGKPPKVGGDYNG